MKLWQTRRAGVRYTAGQRTQAANRPSNQPMGQKLIVIVILILILILILKDGGSIPLA
jgi:hypothetical protein